MKVLVYLGHPAHFHLYKYIIPELQKHDHTVFVVIKKKDILEELLKSSGFDYENILPEGRKNSKFSIFWTLLKRDYKLLQYCRKHKPDLMIGSSVEITHITRLTGIPSIVTVEDDIQFVKPLAKVGYPFATGICVPKVCKVGEFEPKTCFYEGYQKLAYLHPKRFTPDENKVRHLYKDGKPYFILRVVSFTAYHDFKAAGMTDSFVQQIIQKLESKGTVYISAERDLPAHLQKYALPIAIEDIHHALYYALLYIGDSQSMAVEAALLGTPGIRYNCWVGKVSVLEELEHRFQLTFGVPLEEPQKVLQLLDNWLQTANLRELWMQRRDKMLEEKIDVTAFFVWLIENYPQSMQEMKSRPDLQRRFT